MRKYRVYISIEEWIDSESKFERYTALEQTLHTEGEIPVILSKPNRYEVGPLI